MTEKYNDTEGYDESTRYEKLEDNVYVDLETDETVFVLTPEERAIMRDQVIPRLNAEQAD
tara:strand:- start:866 stop:1045 length:180 start_codon:yes stop_codon:yes gene_type:complete